MIKPRRSIRTDLPFRVSVRSRPLDKGWGVGEERNGLKKNCFQFGLKIWGAGGVAGSTPESHRIFMNG